MGAAGTIVVGGAIFLGGAASLVTAFANTGEVAATQNCTTWSVNAGLDNNVDHRLVIVSFPDTSTVVVNKEFTTNSPPQAIPSIFSDSGSAPKTGTITETIYNGNTVGSGVDQKYTATLPAPTDCNASIVTHQSAGGPVGTVLTDSATVTGTLGSPAGSVVFSLFPPSNSGCSPTGDAPVFKSSAINLVSTTPGVSTASTPANAFTSNAPGTYHWTATYTPASSLYKAATSTCDSEPVTVSKASPSITTAVVGGGNVPADVHDTATLSGGTSPTGTVTFVLYPTVADCTAGTNAVSGSTSTVTLSGGKATGDKVTLTAAGTYYWLATYNGDANNASVNSGCSAEPVTTTTISSPSPSPTPAGGVQAITTPGTGGNGSLAGITIGGFLLLGGLGMALAGSMLPRRRRSAP